MGGHPKRIYQHCDFVITIVVFYRCFPPLSVNGFFYPSAYLAKVKFNDEEREMSRGFIFDGFGNTLTNFDESYSVMKTRDNFFSYFDNDFESENAYTTYIKSTVSLMYRCTSYRVEISAVNR